MYSNNEKTVVWDSVITYSLKTKFSRKWLTMTKIVWKKTKDYRTLHSFWKMNFVILLKTFCKIAAVGDIKCF